MQLCSEQSSQFLKMVRMIELAIDDVKVTKPDLKLLSTASQTLAGACREASRTLYAVKHKPLHMKFSECLTTYKAMLDKVLLMEG